MSSNSSPKASKVLAGPFEGTYGTWYLTQADADGVQTYRLAVLAMAASTAAATALALTSGALALGDAPFDALALLFALAFAAALQTIHIYAKPLHNALKALWAVGFAGGAALAASPLTAHGVVVSAFGQPALLLAVGWQFVALTGLFIKEAACFNRAEAKALIFLVPLLSGGHFLGALPAAVEQFGAVVYSALFLVFAARKFLQPAADDIGDMSVFTYLENGGKLGQ